MDSRPMVMLAILIIGVFMATLNLAQHHADVGSDANELRQHLTSCRVPDTGGPAAGVVAALSEGGVSRASAALESRPREVALDFKLAQPLRVSPGGLGPGGSGAPTTPAAADAASGSVEAGAAENGTPVPPGLAVDSGGGGAALQGMDSQAMLSQRTCGSPATEAYTLVRPQCLYDSPTARWWKLWRDGGGRAAGLVVHVESHSDLDGLAVRWGIDHEVPNMSACGEACRSHVPNPSGGGFEPLPCNTFSFCPDAVCWEPDAHNHTQGDCWLKFSEGPASPEVNMRGRVSEAARLRHPQAPPTVQWQSGVLLPPGVRLSNGTWGPRYDW